jgi:hypothetical protein
MREQSSPPAIHTHTPSHSVRPRPPYTGTSVFQNLSSGTSHYDIPQGPLIEGFPHRNATPKDIGPATTRSVRNHLANTTAALGPGDSRGIFSKISAHCTVGEREVKANRSNTKSPPGGTTRDSATGSQSEGSNRILPAVTMSDKADRVYEHAENGRLTARQKLSRHCAKWWWAHLLVFLAIVVLVVCLM